MKAVITIIGLLLLSPALDLLAQEESMTPRFSGQAISWTNLNFSKPFKNQWGIRYIPSLSGGLPLNDKWRIDAEASVNAYASTTIVNGDWESSARLKPYRLWFRLSTDQFELRTGLQKINFGSATMLRPLMWFDRIDPRDPLQLTDGVYAALARYYFLNNANIWLWFLYGNQDPKGWELLSTAKKRPEYGGRIQYPLSTGELGLSYHHRQVGPDSLYIPGMNGNHLVINEDRLGLDGKWDVGPGIWFEEVLKHRGVDKILPEWENYLTLGIDYTFGLGNGLTATLEQFFLNTSKTQLSRSPGASFTALNMTYPLGLTDMFSTILYYNWDDGSFYRFLSWQRTYDKWSFYLMGYWNPDIIAIYRNLEGNNLFSGKGFQLMIVFNH